MDRDRAGEDGEYHHSRNLMKKMAVGSNTFRLSSRRRGDEMRRRRSFASSPSGSLAVGFIWAVSLAARCTLRISIQERHDAV